MPKTFIEIPFDTRLLTDLEQIAEDEGADVTKLINSICAVYLNSFTKEI